MTQCEAAMRYFAFLPGGPALIPCEGKRPVLPDWPRAIDDPPAWRLHLAGHSGNVGLVAGGGLVVLDVDLYADDDVEEAWQEFIVEHGLPITLAASTPSGGRHYFYRTSADIGTGNLAELDPRLARVDVRGRGGQVIVEPSLGANGTPYLFLDGRASEEGSEIVATLPASAEAAILTVLSATTAPEDVDVDDRSRELTERAADLLRRYGATARWVKGGFMYVTRPGRHEEATSGSIGNPQVGAGTLHVFSTNWPPFTAGRNYSLPELRDLLEPPEPKVDDAGRRREMLLTVSAARSEIVRWLWQGRIPAGQLTLVGGPEKLGKSSALVWASARLSRGELPGDFEGEPRNVVFVSAEDTVAHVLKPRFAAAGGDLSKVFVLDPLGPGFSIEGLAGIDAGLVVVDPMGVFINLAGDEHGDVAVRKALQEFSEYAERSGAGVAGIRHTRKAAVGGNVHDVFLGARAWTAAPRALLMFVQDRENPDRPGGLIFSRGNLARPEPGMRYRLDSHTVGLDDGNTADVPVFTVDPMAVTISLEDALGPAEQTTARQDAEEFLRELLDGGPVKADEVLRRAKVAEISEKTLRRAKRDLGVVSGRVGFGPGSELEWRLPVDGQDP